MTTQHDPDGHHPTPEELREMGFPDSIASDPGLGAWVSSDGKYLGLDFSACRPEPAP